MITGITAPTHRREPVKTVGKGLQHRPSIDGATRRRLLRWNSLKDWQKRESVNIESGFREATPSLSDCVKSWFYLHNETVNIFTHLLGSMLFIALAFVLYSELSLRYNSWSTGDVLAFGIFMFGTAFCFGLSAAFHTCASHSLQGYHLARQLDFFGIIVLVLSTSAPQVYYTFYTEPMLQRNYWALIICFGTMAAAVTLTPSFYKPSRNSARVAVFAGLGLSTFAPVMHGILLHGWDLQSHRFPISLLGLTHAFNISGAIVYVLHFPERWWPRVFDIFGASHQLMHCAIVGAALSLLTGSVIAFDHVHGVS